MNAEYVENLVEPENRAAARALFLTLSDRYSEFSLDYFVAMLREQGLLSDAGFQQYHSNDTLELTQVIQLPPLADTVILGDSDGDATAATKAGDTARVNPAAQSDYQLLGRLNAGGMGEIQLAKDKSLRRKVAYKQLLESTMDVPGLAQRFLVEAQVMAQLDHPNVVPVYALEDQGDGRYAYAMKLVRGQTLAEVINAARAGLGKAPVLATALSRETLLEHFLKVCDAMAYAHSKGVIHRDLKPDNIMIGRFNEVYVMDWGLARLIDSPDLVLEDPSGILAELSHNPADNRTRIGDILGTPRYMAPEQAAGANTTLDGRSDVYALGLILYELLSLGKARPSGSSLETLLENARQGVLPALQAPAPDLAIAQELRAIVATATALAPAQRYQTVTALADDIRRFLHAEPISVLQDSLVRKTQRWIGRHRQATLLMIMGIIVLALTTTSLSLYQRYVVLEHAQNHIALVSRFVTGIAEHNDLIEKQFLLFTVLLEDLAATAVAARLYGIAVAEPIYTPDDYRKSNNGPADLASASRYDGKPISTEYPVNVVSSKAQTSAAALLRQLTPLRHQFRRIAVLSADVSNTYLDQASAHALIAEQGVPLRWAYIGLEEGVLLLYPGFDLVGLANDYDPRQTLWYQQSLTDRDGKFCSSFRPDPLGSGLLLSCHIVMLDDARQPLGVAGIGIPLDFLIDKLLRVPDPKMVESFLLDKDGHIMIRSNNYQLGQQTEERPLEGPLYPEPEVLARLRQGQFGHLEIERDGRPLWIVYDAIESLGWSYVVEFDPEN